MTPAVVVDVGNSRIKWGRCRENALHETVSLLPEDPAGWQQQLQAWSIDQPVQWVVSGVHPRRCASFTAWLRQHGQSVRPVDDWSLLPLTIPLAQPADVGMDRLLNAVAARSRLEPGGSAIIVDAGSAVTVDWVDRAGAFRGGAILPGQQLMAKALHEHTALLPLLESFQPSPTMPGTSTMAAMQAGIGWSVAGGAKTLVDMLLEVDQHEKSRTSVAASVFVTGGNGAFIHPALVTLCAAEPHRLVPVLWPQMTLEGIRLAVEAWP